MAFVTDGLQLHWTANSTDNSTVWKDTAGSSANATLTNFNLDGTDGWTYDNDGVSLKFDGNNDSLVIPSVAQYNNCTICMTFKSSDITNGHYLIDFGVWMTYGFSLYHGSGNTYRFDIGHSGVNERIVFSMDLAPINKVTLVLSGTSLKIYQNGTKILDTTLAAMPAMAPNYRMYIGSYYGNADTGYAMNLFRFMYYNRAITEAEVAQNEASTDLSTVPHKFTDRGLFVFTEGNTLIGPLGSLVVNNMVDGLQQYILTSDYVGLGTIECDAHCVPYVNNMYNAKNIPMSVTGSSILMGSIVTEVINTMRRLSVTGEYSFGFFTEKGHYIFPVN